MSDIISKNETKSDSNFASTFVDLPSSPDIIFNGQCSIKNNICISRNVINLYISYILGLQLRNSNTDFKLSNYWFGFVKIIYNAGPDKCKYTGYGIGCRSKFLFPDGSYEKNVITSISSICKDKIF